MNMRLLCAAVVYGEFVFRDNNKYNSTKWSLARVGSKYVIWRFISPVIYLSFTITRITGNSYIYKLQQGQTY